MQNKGLILHPEAPIFELTMPYLSNTKIKTIRSVRGGVLTFGSKKIECIRNGHFYQSGSVSILPIRRVPYLVNLEGSVFAYPEGSQFADPEGSKFFVRSRRRLISPIRWGPDLVNLNGPSFAEPEGSLFVYPEGSHFADPEGSSYFVRTRRGPILSTYNGHNNRQFLVS